MHVGCLVSSTGKIEYQAQQKQTNISPELVKRGKHVDTCVDKVSNRGLVCV